MYTNTTGTDNYHVVFVGSYVKAFIFHSNWVLVDLVIKIKVPVCRGNCP